MNSWRSLMIGIAFLATGPVRAADDGAATFNTSCAGCHGQDGAGDTPVGKSTGVPDLRSSQVQSQPDARLADVIENGTSKMPAFKSSLNGDQVKTLVAHVRTLAR